MSEATVERTRWGGLWRRWPTALAIPPAVLTLTGDDAQSAVTEVLPLLPLEYLIVAKLGRRELTWPLIGVLFAATFGLMEQDTVPVSGVFAGLALVVLVWSAVDGQLFRDGELQLQTLGMLGFGAVALVGLTIDTDLARYVVAAGWLLHGVWDFVHIWRDKVVPRSYAEWCGVLDILTAFGLIFLL
jgi:hypothetical protein